MIEREIEMTVSKALLAGTATFSLRSTRPIIQACVLPSFHPEAVIRSGLPGTSYTIDTVIRIRSSLKA